MSSLSASFSPLMWPVLISSAATAAVPSPLVEKDSLLTEEDAPEHSTLCTMHKYTHTRWSTFEQWEEAALTENGFFWGREWKDQVAVKSTKPRATLSEARWQQLLFSRSLRRTQHAHTLHDGDSNTQEQAALWPFRSPLTNTDFDIFSDRINARHFSLGVTCHNNKNCLIFPILKRRVLRKFLPFST